MVSRYEPRYEPHYEGRYDGTKGFASKDILVFFQGIDPRGDRSGAPNGLVMVARNGASRAEAPDQPQFVLPRREIPLLVPEASEGSSV